MPPNDSMLPKRGSLVNECVRVMRARIAAGDWTVSLPGERHLSQSLNVGRDTLRLALAELTSCGEIEPGRSGRPRHVIARHSASPAGKRRAQWRFCMLSPTRLEQVPSGMLVEVNEIRAHLAMRGATLDIQTPTWYQSSSPEKRIHALLGTQPRDGWILYRAPKAVQAAFQHSGVPCVIRGHAHAGIHLPYLDTDWKAVGRHAMGEMWRLGHRRICMVAPNDGMRGNIAAWEGMQSLGESNVTLAEIWTDGTLEGLTTSLAAVMEGPARPTAFIILRPEHAMTLLSWFASRGLWMPRDFAVIALAADNLTNHLVPALSTYYMAPGTFAQRVVRQLEWLADGRTGASGKQLLMPEFVRSGSVGRLAPGA